MCVSSSESPKAVEPLLVMVLSLVTEDDTINLCAVTSPLKFISEPLIVPVNDIVLPDCGAIVLTFNCDMSSYPHPCIKNLDGTIINCASSSIVKFAPSPTVKLSPKLNETLSPEKV